MPWLMRRLRLRLWRLEVTRIPQDVIDHCAKHPMCKGCPLGTCVGPVSQYPSDVWDKWYESRIEAVRELYRDKN